MYVNRFYWKLDINFLVVVCGILKVIYDLGYDLVKVCEVFMVVGILVCKLDEYI